MSYRSVTVSDYVRTVDPDSVRSIVQTAHIGEIDLEFNDSDDGSFPRFRLAGYDECLVFCDGERIIATAVFLAELAQYLADDAQLDIRSIGYDGTAYQPAASQWIVTQESVTYRTLDPQSRRSWETATLRSRDPHRRDRWKHPNAVDIHPLHVPHDESEAHEIAGFSPVPEGDELETLVQMYPTQVANRLDWTADVYSYLAAHEDDIYEHLAVRFRRLADHIRDHTLAGLGADDFNGIQKGRAYYRDNVDFIDWSEIAPEAHRFTDLPEDSIHTSASGV